jgi:hypothetical protein
LLEALAPLLRGRNVPEHVHGEPPAQLVGLGERRWQPAPREIVDDDPTDRVFATRIGGRSARQRRYGRRLRRHDDMPAPGTARDDEHRELASCPQHRDGGQPRDL